MTATSAVSGAALDGLESRLQGRLIRPGDLDYDGVRAVFNAMIDRRPAAVVRCQNPSDVARGIAFARNHDLALSVRGGGHNVVGNAVSDGGIMLDLSPMRDLHVDPHLRRRQRLPPQPEHRPLAGRSTLRGGRASDRVQAAPPLPRTSRRDGRTRAARGPCAGFARRGLTRSPP